MAQLAIKGHPTRGNEVIEILEMLGGKITGRELYGNVSHYGYYIHNDGYISLTHCSLLKNAIVFTLEEFLEKFPYKVGDKVIDTKTDRIAEIYKAHIKISPYRCAWISNDLVDESHILGYKVTINN